MKDAVAFMRWERVVPWKILTISANPDGPMVPVGFGARYLSFQHQIEPGSQIWVVTRILNEFSLAGRVTVDEMIDREQIQRSEWPPSLVGLLRQWRFVAKADPTKSAFFETNNAQSLLDALGIRFAQNRTVVYHEGSLKGDFQDCMDQARRTVFISYRWKEARRFAIALARQFRQNDFSPWLDAVSIPTYEASREPDVDRPRLKKLLRNGIEMSEYAVVINTETFGESYWTGLEFDHIRTVGKPWYQVMRKGSEHAGSQLTVRKRKSAEVAQEIIVHRESSLR